MRTKSRLAAALTVVLTVTLAGFAGQPSAAVAADVSPTEPSVMPSVPGEPVPVKAPAPDPASKAAQVPVPDLAWPQADAATASTSAGGAVQVRVLDQAAASAAGVQGLLVSVAGMSRVAAGEKVKLSIDYSRLRNLYGGDWATRLRLVDVDRDVVLPATNDVAGGKLASTVEAGAVGSTLAVTAATGGSAGDFAATTLSPAGQWAVSTQSGAFSWSYNLRTPPAPGGLAPSLSLSYSSAAVDGRTASTNNQPSWLGEGWSLWPGYVERSYRGCADTEGKPKTGDLCWINENAVMALGGATNELVREGTSQRWRPKADDGTRVEQRFDKAANGDVRGEYWVVTTTDGFQYHYGSRVAAESTWTVPVFGDSPGEGCGGAFATSDCVRAWRWNLDYVVDPHGSTITYQYRAETNRYARNQTDASVATYTRGGWLERIDYGDRAGEPAAGQVVFAVADRCRPDMPCAQHTGAVWPDVPWDWECTGASCPDKYSPTFWSTKRLASITTKVRSGTAYLDVDQWSFDHIYPDPGDGTSAGLWLRGITHTGLVGGSQPLPPVTFAGSALANRVDSPTDGPPQLNKFRIETVHNGSGGDLNVVYAPPNCKAGALPSPATNTLRCFPARWVMSPEPEPRDDWFHVYAVGQITQVDRVAGGMTEVLNYEYLGGGAWRYDDNPLIAEKYRTWSLWRGYEKVQVRHGDPVQEPGRPVSLTQYQYFRGMHGDRAAATGGTKPPVDVTDSAGTALADLDPLAGSLREQITYDGVGGAVVSGAIHDPWVRGPTATQGSRQAFQVQTVRMANRTALAGGGFRRTQVDTAYDNEGNATQVNDLGDTATAADDRCTRTDYARNETAWLLNLPSRVATVGVACDATPSYPDDAISDVRTYYDGLAWDAAPSAGNATMVEEADSYAGSTAHYLTVSTATHDGYGRVLDSFDALQRKNATRYEPEKGPVTATSLTNSLGQTVTTTLNPAWGVPVTVVIASQARTDIAYDPLGRLAGVWRPGRSKVDLPDQPNVRYVYAVQNDAPSWVRTDTLVANGNYVSSFTMHDGFLRERQTQAPNPKGGRTVTDALTDSRGLTYLAKGPYHQDAAPGTSLVEPDINKVPSMTLTRFNGVERAVEQIYLTFNAEPNDGRRWRTSTAYGGDRVTVTPRTGAPPTTTISDARGQTTEVWQYRGATPSGDHDVTQYRYTKSGEITQVTDPAGNAWRYEYDIRGRRTVAVDPDSGRSEMTYDNASQLLTITDARGKTITNEHDDLGRLTTTRSGSTVLAKWIYDTLKPGLLTSSTRYQAGGEYTRAVTGYNEAGQPTGEQVSFPGTEIGIVGTASFTTTTTYKVDGSPNLVRLPALSTDVPAETLTHGYDTLGGLLSLKGNTATGSTTYLNRATYTALGEPELMEFGAPAAGPHVWQQWTYEDGTRRLSTALTEREQTGNLRVDLLSYAYDPTGNLLSLKDEMPGVAVDNQCFRYDHRRRVTDAWTQTGACAAAPSTAVIGGPAPYWQSYGHDVTGNRTGLTRHGLNGAADVLSTYSYPAAGQPRPHAVTGVQTAGSAAASYDYDAAGNTVSRPGPGGQQTLAWDTEGRLASITAGANTTSYRYDAAGGTLIRRDPGTVTVFLGGGELVYNTATKATTGTRYYSVGDRVIAVRTGGALQWLVADHHGTSQLTVDPTTLTATTRRFDPYGNPRGPASTWPGGDRGFVGGIRNDTTGLTRLGAREYDASIGRFVSVDPVIDLNDPQQMNGYSYANNNPVTMSDPTGLIPAECGVDYECYGYNPFTGCPYGCGTAANQAYGMRQSGSAPVCSVPDRDCRSPQAKAKAKSSGGKRKPTFDFEYLKKHGRPRPDTDPRVYDDQDTVNKIMNMCAWIGGDADCDPDFHMQVLDQVFVLAGYSGGTPEFIATEGIGRGGGKGSRGSRGSGTGKPFCRSFSSDTPVLMADGTSKPIGEIQPGDRVLATDPETGEQSAQTVAAVWAHPDDLVDLRLRKQDGSVTVTTTDDHFFWNDTDKQWQPVGEIDPGDRLRTADGSVATVVGLLESTWHRADAYNLTVTNLHTYYVLAGTTPVLVHNDDDIPNVVSTAIENIKNGNGEARLNPDKSLDIFEGRGVAPKVARKWTGSQIYNVPGSQDRYRILVNQYGDVGWVDVDDKKYQKIVLTGTKIVPGGPARATGGC
ncbi:RHS repeat-associated core domain-containing protein [Phytohabitans rumicis]|uniref:Hint domain-containing protein n=1 Tax=Phytohabitans rumicis TaxID=1076125 RepID=A0A6V8LDH1_9ACTN|nr:RHS repeat-associated core domain-containing protein [Phytohabitans rumicis]GFJ93700.1 hypothetical protein Prum_073420 [Phytohabitans rumicis]